MMPPRKPFIPWLPAIIILMLVASAAIAAPVKLIDAAKMGAVGDGATVNTGIIQKEIDDCSAGGGGTIEFTAGRYVTGTIQLKDNVTLHLDQDAILLGSTNSADYRNVDPFTAGDGIPLGYALIVADGAHHVSIEGAGAIDGRGKELRSTQPRYTVRPFLMRWLRCTDVVVRDVHLSNPGAWTLNFFQSRNITVQGVTIRTRDTGLPNNDGIDLDSCQNAQIRGCDIESGDDALCLKATSTLPCRDITASDCKLGTESLGDFANISVTNCQIRNTGMAGIALYSVDGANLHDVTLDGITMAGVAVPVSVRLGARLKIFRPGDQAEPPGTLRDVTIKNVNATGARQIGVLISGIPDHPVENLTLENIQIELPGGGQAANARVQLPEKPAAYPQYNMFGKIMPAYGIYARHVRNLNLTNVQINVKNPDARPEKVLIDAGPGSD